jgi:P-type conjugative transfer protein TrbJ
MDRKLLLLTAAAGLALLPLQPASADISQSEAEAAFEGAIKDALDPVLGNIIEILLVIIQAAGELPEDPSEAQLRQLAELLGVADRTYLRLDSLRPALDELYPDEPEITTADGAIEHARLRHEDRQGRILEAMELAATIAGQRADIDARLAALTALNRSPAGNLAAGQIGNEAALQAAASVEMLTRLTAELGQLEADQRAQEDWSRLQSNTWMQEHYRGGFWTGTRTWTPGTFRRSF